MPRDREPNAEGNESERKQGMPGSGSDRAWWRPPSWSRSPLLHEWIRSGAVLIAAVWGVYTFIYKDIYVPSQQPAHLNLEASLKPVPDRPRPTAAAGLEMLLEIKATNASSRRVYLLANVWTLRGVDTAPRTGPKVESDFLQESIQLLRDGSLLPTERGVRRTAGKMIAVGRLLGDEFIDPGNAVNRSILVHIPKEYDAVELSLTTALLSRLQDRFPGQRLVLEVNADGDLKPLLCSTNRNSNNSGPDCRQYNDKDDSDLQRYDPYKATVTLTQQIGLPMGAGN
jgi:nitroreductase